MNLEERQAFIIHRIEKAEASLKEVKVLYEIGHYSTAASRLYYAAFYSASALLAKEKFEIKTHTGIRNELNRAFVKSGVLSREQGRLYSKLFDLRQLGDYGDVKEVTKEDLDIVKDIAFDLINEILLLVQQK